MKHGTSDVALDLRLIHIVWINQMTSICNAVIGKCRMIEGLDMRKPMTITTRKGWWWIVGIMLREAALVV